MNLAQQFRHQTFVFVSHRISAPKWMDRIIVLNGGVIEEQGTHDQLIRTGGVYSHLHSIPAALAGTTDASQVSGNI
jgi:ABC-type bacteriocin/lantibiotic exporter with double-glycine peptidase domain